MITSIEILIKKKNVFSSQFIKDKILKNYFEYYQHENNKIYHFYFISTKKLLKINYLEVLQSKELYLKGI